MNFKLRARFSRLSMWLCMALLAALSVTAASAQPTLNLPPGSVTPTVTFSSTLSLPSYLEVQFPSLPSGYDINSIQTYLSWCVQANEALDFSGPGPTLYSESTASYVLYNNYPNSALPSPDQNPNWPQVNYILNHKNGASVADIQEAIWFLLDGTYHANSFIGGGPFPSPGTTALLNDAMANGGSFVPQPGQVVAVLLYGNTDTLNADGNNPQDLIIEVPVPTPPGGTIGDFVWRDSNKNGIQDCGELGINGVTIQLYQNSIAPGNLVATTTTGSAPSGYTSNYALACQTDGYYQFTGLAPGNYIVAIPSKQTILNELVLTLSFQGTNTSVDSNGVPGPTGYSAVATVNVPSSTTIDETIDFGYYGPINPSTSLTTKSVSPGTTVEPNTNITVVVTETNTGDSPIMNISVAGGGACASFSPSSIPSLASGGAQDFTCTFNSGNTSGGWSAAASGTDAAGNPAPTTGESTSGAFTVIHPSTMLTFKSVSPGTTLEANTAVTVVVTEKNTGDSPITNISVAGGGACANFTPSSVTLSAGATQDFTCTFNSGTASGSWTAAANGADAAGNPAPSVGESTSGSFTVVSPRPPQLVVTKVPDSATVTAGTQIGFTVTISNPGGSAANQLVLADPLPTGGNEFFKWTIDTTTGNPADFTILGSPGSQSLALSPAFLASPDSLAAGQSISVHITTPTTIGDVSGGAVGVQAGVSSSAYLGAAGNYGVLYIVGSGTHNLQVTNVTLGANIGVGSAVGGNGVGNVSFNGPGIITGRLDFAPGQTNQFSNNNGSNVGPASVNTNVAAVTSAIGTVTNLSSAFGALTGTSIAIHGSQTINESAGTYHTLNGITYSVFTVTSYSENDGSVFTINGDGSGDPVVLNFGPNTGNINLGGDVAMIGNGLSDDKVIWNFTSANQNIQLNNNASSYPSAAFHGIILAPDDGIHLVNANLSGRVYGGDNQDMQLVSGLTVHAPIMNRATVTGSNVSSSSSSATITVTGPFLPYAHFAELNVPYELRGLGIFNVPRGTNTTQAVLTARLTQSNDSNRPPRAHEAAPPSAQIVLEPMTAR